MRILFTNNTLAGRAGSELYVRDLALAMLRRGHNPVAYSTDLGEVAEELRRATVPVVDNLSALAVPPDVIHGQHHLDAMTAMLRFPDTPAVLVCHGWLPWEERPYPFPSIHRYVAVDDLCRERLLSVGGITEECVEVFYNFVDLARFPRRSELPERPRAALVFSNYSAMGETLEIIRAACASAGIQKVDVIGAGSGNATETPERILGGYDLVFAKARCALEALATGCAVVVADYNGLGGMVTPQNAAALRVLNFGVRTLQNSRITFENVVNALSLYDPAGASTVCDWIRSSAGLESAADRWQGLYEEAIMSSQSRPCGGAEELARAKSMLCSSSEYLSALAPRLKALQGANLRAAQAEAELQRQRSRGDMSLRNLERFLRHLRKGLLRKPPRSGT